MITKILIANRGEIALRIIRTARNKGYRTVAVYSDADTEALHVRAADEAVCIGAAAAGESYLAWQKILDAAASTGADAVHPGYGFLAENAGFARACEEAGLIFIGPGADAMELMGSKRLSKAAMLEAGVPCMPGYQGPDQSEETLLAEAEKIGVPLMVKASAGGGGRGMRLVTEAGEIAGSIKNARAEARSTFGSGELILEKAILEPRHIEMQIFADTLGNAVYMGERDCSIQRRHQKVIEEAPSPFVDASLRRRMGEAAVNAARACGYRGAGTVEFLVDKDKNFYFLEMNTRLQVEHPVTEMITGLDLVAWQLRVASGERLPLSQEEIAFGGHAIEARVYAEDARRDFLPQTGRILGWEVPARESIRDDSGIAAGQEISPHYDPILAKIIAWGQNREEARRRLASALCDTVLLGINNNKRFLEGILGHSVFAEGNATTAFIKQHFNQDISMAEDALPSRTLALAAMLSYQRGAPGREETCWRNPAPYRYNMKLRWEGTDYGAALVKQGSRFSISLPEEVVDLEWVGQEQHELIYKEQGVRRKAWFAVSGHCICIDDGSGHFIIEDQTLEPPAAADAAAESGNVASTMNGVVVDVQVAEGEFVVAGQALMTVEAMKMQHQITAPLAGRVASIMVSAGDQVKPRELLVQLTTEETEGASP